MKITKDYETFLGLSEHCLCKRPPDLFWIKIQEKVWAKRIAVWTLSSIEKPTKHCDSTSSTCFGLGFFKFTICSCHYRMLDGNELEVNKRLSTTPLHTLLLIIPFFVVRATLNAIKKEFVMSRQLRANMGGDCFCIQ